MQKLYHSILTFCLLFAVVFSTACPKSDPVRKAVEASYRLPGLTNDLIDATRDAFRANLISLNQKNRIAESLQKMAGAEIEFVRLTDDLAKIQAATGRTDAGRLAALSRLFDEQIVAPFLDVLGAVKLLNADQAAAIGAAAAAVKLLLATIGTGFRSTAVSSLGAK